jgi:transposase
MAHMSESPSTTPAEPDWAAFAAIDWGDQKHFWKLVPAGTQQYEQGELAHTPEALQRWATALRERFGGRPIAVCVEQKRGALVYALAPYTHLVIFPVHPTLAARYRSTFRTSGAKDDPGDADSLLDLWLQHRAKLRPLQPDTPETRLLQHLVEHRRRLVDEKTRQVLRLRQCLKEFFPQLLQWFEDLDTPLVEALLERWPSLQDCKGQHPGTWRQFFHQHNCRSEERIRERIEAIYAATPLTEDPAVVQAGSLKARGLAALLQTLRRQIAAVEQRIDQLVAAHPDGPLFASLPGAGRATVPRLIAAFGTRRELYASAYDMQCYSGIGPVQKSSGKTCAVHFRQACPKFVRQTFQEFAGQSILQSEWARAYYQLQRDRQKSHHAAVRSLAFKWIRIIYRCWRDGCPYDEQLYLTSLRRRGALLGPALAAATAPGWKSVAGFQRFCVDPS